uniref:Uncharacterized protein n=1 Tax=viral metagenome TaxID=1070528 RepID=A0A6C0J5Q1_9ZZZZ
MRDTYGEGPLNTKSVPILYHIDSSAYSNKNNYTVDIESFGNVTSIELVQAIIPNTQGANFIIIDIYGKNILKGNTSNLSGAFCTIVRDTGLDNSYFIYKRNNSIQNPLYTYYSSPTKLGQLKISFKLPDGSSPAFGDNDHYLIFEIHTFNQRLPN